MHRLLLPLLLLSFTAAIQPARAADAPGAGSSSAKDANAYVFGTSLVLTSPKQLADPNKGFWGDALPTAYNFSQGSIVDAVNAARKARGETEMVDVKNYPINIGSVAQLISTRPRSIFHDVGHPPPAPRSPTLLPDAR